MKCYVIVRNQICEQVVCTDNADLTFDEDVKLYEIDKIYDANDLYCKNDKVLKKPISPSVFYSWDNTSNSWMPDNNKAWSGIKIQRNTLLQQSDWTQLPDISIKTKTQWAIYRQELRDITLQSDPFNIVWPTPPQG
jgi:hypothetical protein